MSLPVVVVSAVLAALAVVVLRPRLHLLAGAGPRWPVRVLAPVLAGAGGAGAALLASGVAELIGFVALAVGCAALVGVDVTDHRLPDVLTLPTAGVLLAALCVAAVAADEPGRLGRAALAGLALAAAYLLTALVSPSSIGLGDVKLAGVLGLFLGWFSWSHVLVGTVAAFVLGGLVAVGLLVTRRASRHTAIPFGPWLVAGAAVGAAWPVTGL